MFVFATEKPTHNEANYKAYKNYARDNRKKIQKNLLRELFPKYKNDVKNTWNIINEVIGNTKNKQKDIPEKIVINNATVRETQEIAKNLNKYFTNISPNLAFKTPNEQGGFENFLANCNSFMDDAPLTNEE